MTKLKVALVVLGFAMPIAAHAEPNWGGGNAYGGGGTHSPRVGPSGYHDPNVPAKVTHDAIMAAVAKARAAN